MLVSVLLAAAVSAQVVKVELTVSATGAVTGCAVVESTATPELDAATCQTSMRRTRQPARDASGTPIESKTVVTVRYQAAAPESVG